jgi:pimeloyl-ACP methyl ester carboxylesterase
LIALCTALTQADSIVASKGIAISGVARSARSPIQIDGVAAQIVAGTFHPQAGDRVGIPLPISAEKSVETSGIWKEIKPDENGSFDSTSFSGGYLALSFESPANQIMLLEATGHGMVYFNGPHMGDPYATGYQRIPLEIKKGINQLVFAAGRGPISAKLVAPRINGPQFDTRDLTAPDLVVGESLDAWIGIRIINAANIPATNLAIEIESQDGITTRTPVAMIVPLGIFKAPARIRSGPFGLEGPARFRVALVRADSPDGDAKGMLDETTIELTVKSSTATRKETFQSKIEGSAQYFAVVPAAKPTIKSEARPGIVLSLHGASVEALGQAQCYAPRDWAFIIAPTNRRPYGFDWEDWGRIDALEVLDTARKRFRTDPLRQWLTGHSMGGHGTWQIGAQNNDIFAAIAPSAGWISFFTYVKAPTAAIDANDFVGKILDRSANPSRTLLLKNNYASQGVYVLHGDADDNVPVTEAREMRAQLGSFHPDFAYHEQPGAGHWWGNECVDWPPLMDFLKARTLPLPESRDHISFTTISPNNHATNGWVTIDAQLVALESSHADMTIDRKAKSVSGTTSNIARLGLSVDLDGDDAQITLDIDGVKLVATEPDGGDLLWIERTLAPDGTITPWRISTPPNPNQKCAARMGPFKTAFTNHPVLVYGTSGTQTQMLALLAKARYDNEQFVYRGNASFEIVDDKFFLQSANSRFKNRNIILYGNAETNAAWNSLLATSPITVRNNEIIVTTSDSATTTIKGDDLGAVFAFPRPNSDTALVGVVAGTGAVGQSLLDRAPYFVAGTGYPDLAIFRANMLEVGSVGAVGAAFFSNDWTLSPVDVLLWRKSQ